MKNRIGKLIAAIFWVGIMYLFGCFINVSFNPLVWGVFSKLCFGLWSIFVTITYGFYIK